MARNVPHTPSPPEGEGGARLAKPSGRVRGHGGYAPQALAHAKRLRRNPTDAERTLWRALRGGQLGGAKFRRQQPVGPYIADFVCHQCRLIVEADGGQHAESAKDDVRTRFLEAAGYRVLRFWNHEILTNPGGVLIKIEYALATPHPPTAARRAPPSPSRGEGFDGAIADG